MAETWIINETPNAPSDPIMDLEITFEANNTAYTGFMVTIAKKGFNIDYGLDTVYSNYLSGIYDWELYRTVTFETAPTGELLTWLQENAVKQAPAITDPLDNLFTDIADAIREKKGTTDKIKPSNFAEEISNISPELQSKTVTPSTQVQNITPDANYDGLSEVTVNAIPSAYIIPTGTSNITANGTYDITNYKSVNVNVAGSGGGDDSLLNSIIEGKVTELNIPNVSKVKEGTFGYCLSLTIASFPNCSRIGSSAFSQCSNLTTVSFPNCSYIGSYAFTGCSKLTIASFPNCSYIANCAFSYCSKLTTVSIPNCSHIGSSVFYKCLHLKSLYLLSTQVCSLLNSSAFLSTPIAGYTGSTGGVYGSIYVPASLLASYKAATNWAYFSSRFVGI